MLVNKYAWSKLGGECAVRLYDKALIIRTSFGPDEFPLPRAFTDQWTSRRGGERCGARRSSSRRVRDLRGSSCGGPRRTVLEYTHDLDPAKEIGALSIKDVSFSVPVDTSLDTSRFSREVGN